MGTLWSGLRHYDSSKRYITLHFYRLRHYYGLITTSARLGGAPRICQRWTFAESASLQIWARIARFWRWFYRNSWGAASTPIDWVEFAKSVKKYHFSCPGCLNHIIRIWLVSPNYSKITQHATRGNVGSHRLNFPNLTLTNKFPQGSSDATCTHSFGTLTRSHRAKAPSFDPLCNTASYQENRRAPDRKSMGAPTNFSSAVTID